MGYEVFLDLALIIIFAKVFGILARKLKAPQVVGEILAGLLLGPAILGWVQASEFLATMAEIGVVLLMFSAGLETNLRQLARSGLVATLIACFGVAVPMAGGTALYMLYYGVNSFSGPEFHEAIFIGCIMTATSVGITVEALREMGYLKGRVGTTILSAAIIDDVIGIIVLTFVLGLKDESLSPLTTVRNTVLFFAAAFLLGYVCYRLFRKYDQLHPHTRRIPILGLALCLLIAYSAEKFFGIADITGAFVAGIILCNIRDSKYIAEKMDINSYMLFGPVFFASIGIKTSIDTMSVSLLVFSILFVIVAMVTKVIGCGAMAKMCKFKNNEALKIGCGMMTRGEVALIISQKGLKVGLMTSDYFTAVILLIIVSSIVTPITLKLCFNKWKDAECEADATESIASEDEDTDSDDATTAETVASENMVAPAAIVGGKNGENECRNTLS